MSAALMEFDADATSLRDDTPARRVRSLAPRVETYSYILSPVYLVGASRVTPLLPLFTLSMDGVVRHLSRPLMLRVALEEGQYFVENNTLRLFGHGVTLTEATEAFSRDLAYYWHYYSSLSDDEVAGDGVALKKLYKDLLTS